MLLVLLTCILTVFIELLYLYKMGYRDRDEKTVICCTNIFTNISLNLFIIWLDRRGFIWQTNIAAAIIVLIALEVAVVLTEYLLYRLAFGKRPKLFMHTAIANAISLASSFVIIIICAIFYRALM